ncbi:HNH endonuclease signature motif containing protein [Streptomyces sp. NPDC005576]|uniref:HNH endonuclease signature motif containing protein n=1 Tax=unclassified Streptomyces TaxID=2593676 RepID=UPI0034009667
MPDSPYTHQMLSEAAASSRNMSQAMIRLGLEPWSGSRRYLLDRMRKMGIATSHFEREGTRWTKDVLEPAVAASTTMVGVLRLLGLNAVGGNHSHISRRVRSLGIDTSHFESSTPPSSKGRRHRTLEELLVEQDPATARREQSSRLKRALMLLGTDERCAGCGAAGTWQGHPLPLEVDHIDGNWRNNRVENLRMLCPNCHSTTDTYRGRNKRSRADRRTSSRKSAAAR